MNQLVYGKRICRALAEERDPLILYAVYLALSGIMSLEELGERYMALKFASEWTPEKPVRDAIHAALSEFEKAARGEEYSVRILYDRLSKAREACKAVALQWKDRLPSIFQFKEESGILDIVCVVQGVDVSWHVGSILRIYGYTGVHVLHIAEDLSRFAKNERLGQLLLVIADEYQPDTITETVVDGEPVDTYQFLSYPDWGIRGFKFAIRDGELFWIYSL